MEYPYNDEYMIFNEESGQYVLTPDCLTKRLGVDMLGAINERNGINPSVLMDMFLRLVSDTVYGYIFRHAVNNEMQKQIIAKTLSGRKMIQRAMEYQFIYMRMNGVFLMSPDKEKQDVALSPMCIDALQMTLPEVGRCILYTGC